MLSIAFCQQGIIDVMIKCKLITFILCLHCAWMCCVCRQLKIEGNTALYISKLSSTFFYGVIESAEEFKKAFTENNDSASGEWHKHDY